MSKRRTLIVVAVVLFQVAIITSLLQPAFSSRELAGLGAAYRSQPSAENLEALNTAKAQIQRKHLLIGLGIALVSAVPTAILGRRWAASIPERTV